MIRTDSILKALDIDTDRYPVLSVVGGGGKTSLIFRIMEELTAVGKKVLITTTTHMAYEPDRPFAEAWRYDKYKAESGRMRIYDCCFIGQRKT